MPETKETDWNNFWGQNGSQKYTHISWSKKRILEICAPYLSAPSTVLDAGCGSGFFSKVFCDQGLQVISCDYSDMALEMTRKKTENRTMILKADLLSEDLLPLVEQKCDLIFSDGLLEHFSTDEQGKILTNFRSVLKDDGVVITFVPNLFSPWQIIRPFFMPGIKERPFLLDGLKKIHKMNGFNIFHSGGINVVPFALSPDNFLGSYLGMILYCIAKKES